ncbi:MAG: UPF0149 family protein [Rhodoferax sp.]|nr:UPF0149 family protein [Rhodoferax sp.]
MTQDLPPIAADLADTAPLLTPELLSADEFDEIDAILDELRTRDDETPQWEFCEGFMAALICCRRPIPPSEYLPVLLAIGDEDTEGAASFADAAQHARFMALWTRRWNEVVQALDTKIEALDDEAAYQPEVMDVRGAIAALPEEERAAMEGEEVPSFGQVWALGFMFAVEAWPEEWTAPRNKEAVKWLNAALDVIVTLTEDDNEPPTMSAFDDGEGPPTLSLKRMNDFADAVWAVYNLREMWRSIGPRVETVHKVATPGRNDPCSCGSGKKYKKCCGAT